MTRVDRLTGSCSSVRGIYGPNSAARVSYLPDSLEKLFMAIDLDDLLIAGNINWILH